MNYRYFEEFLMWRKGLPKGMGIRVLDLNPDDRVCGYYGKREFILTEPITLKKGHREVTYKASVKKPIKVSTMLQILGERHNQFP